MSDGFDVDKRNIEKTMMSSGDNGIRNPLLGDY